MSKQFNDQLPKEIFDKLVIIGNGYDLSCGLKSSFKDYFDSECLAEISEFIKDNYYYFSWECINKNINFGFFELLMFLLGANREYEVSAIAQEYNFTEMNDLNWSDVEYLIEQTFIGKDGEIYNKFKSLYDGVIKHEGIHKDEYVYFEFYFNLIYNSKIANRHSILPFDEFLKNEVKELENHFANYLNGIVKDNFDYLEKSNKLSNYFNLSFRTYLINFNYTTVLGAPNSNNVHGTLKNNDIIIGIDYGKINEHQDYAIDISKTYRKLKKDCNKNCKLPSDIDEILFFGHSLGEQDFSYFQSIFDSYKIYENSVKLVFYYCDYYVNTDEEKNEILQQYVKRIFACITEYGKTLDNKDQGKNLLHKLLLEGRLNIKLLK